MSVKQQNPDGSWSEAKQSPYPPTIRERIKCFFGFHAWRNSKKYRDMQYCFRCGLRQIVIDVIIEEQE